MKFLTLASFIIILSLQAKAQALSDSLQKAKIDSANLVYNLDQINNAFIEIDRYENRHSNALSVPPTEHDAELYKNALNTVNAIIGGDKKPKRPNSDVAFATGNTAIVGGMNMPPMPSQEDAYSIPDDQYKPLADDYENQLQSIAKNCPYAAHMLPKIALYDTGTWKQKYTVRKKVFELIKLDCK